MMQFNIYYLIFVIPAMIFAMAAQSGVTKAYNEFSKIANMEGLTGAQAARMVLESKGITNVTIEPISGQLTDHFDPTSNVIRLSEGVYNVASVAAVGIASHEAGHAIQHAEGYLPNKIRSSLVPIVNFGSKTSMWLILAGLALTTVSPSLSWIATLGVILFATSTLFSLVTLPVEFDASARALKILKGNNIIADQESDGVAKVLKAAAKTYVAGLAVSIAQLLYLFLTIRRRDDN